MGSYKKQFYVKNRLNFILTIFTCVFATALNIATAFILKLLMDVTTGDSLKDLEKIIICSILYIAVAVLVLLLKRHYYNNYMKHAMVRFKNHAFSKLLGKSINSFDRQVTGKYISIFTNDMASIETNYVEANLKITTQILSFLGGLAAMAYLNWLLMLCVLVISMLPILVSLVFGKSMEEKVRLASARNEGFVSMVKDILTGFSVVKSFRAEKEILGLYKEQNIEVENAKNNKRRTSDFINILSSSSSMVVEFTTFGLGAYLAIKHIITAGTVIAFIQLLNFVLGPVGTLGPLFTERKAAKSLIDKIENATDTIEGEGAADEKESFENSISFQNVTFGYEKEQKVLKSINLTIDKGESCVIVGASGSGKSTLVNLLLGYHNDYEGEICIDGKNLKSLANSSLYNLFSVIQQNVFIFDGTIKDNITMYKFFEPTAVAEVIEKSGLEKLIMEKGEDYKCGENGSFLSGGEKQRISIARSLLRKTPILIMDEATSALDLKTAWLVEEEISRLKDLTRIVISHRMDEGNLRLYDKIIALNNGQITEIGDFDQLMEKRGYFYSLFQVAKSA